MLSRRPILASKQAGKSYRFKTPRPVTTAAPSNSTAPTARYGGPPVGGRWSDFGGGASP